MLIAINIHTLLMQLFALYLFLHEPQEEPEGLEEPFEGKRSAPLPILCVEDGMVILRFSEIFGIHGPLKKGEKRDRRYTIPKGMLSYIWNLIPHVNFKSRDLLCSLQK